MARPKGVKNKPGRPRVTDDLTHLLMARAHLEGGLPTTHLPKLFAVSRTQAHAKTQAVEQQYPEFAQFLLKLGQEDRETKSLAEITSDIAQAEKARSTDDAIARLEDMKRSLADTIEETIRHLLNMSPQELRSMKTEHKLKHIPELVKTMRLLREQSTENIQKLSLVKAVGIATARQKPSE
jgi:hypothetical protein